MERMRKKKQALMLITAKKMKVTKKRTRMKLLKRRKRKEIKRKTKTPMEMRITMRMAATFGVRRVRIGNGTTKRTRMHSSKMNPYIPNL